MSEKFLRSWFSKVMGSDVEWVEPAPGSTLGAPDANVFDEERAYQIELKWGREVKGRLIINMRPSQIRYHTLARRRKRKTAILIGYDRGNNVIIEMVSNAWLNRMEPRYHVASAWDKHEFAKAKVLECLRDKEFWR